MDSAGKPCSLDAAEVLSELALLPQLPGLLLQLPPGLLEPPGSRQHRWNAPRQSETARRAECLPPINAAAAPPMPSFLLELGFGHPKIWSTSVRNW